MTLDQDRYGRSFDYHCFSTLIWPFGQISPAHHVAALQIPGKRRGPFVRGRLAVGVFEQCALSRTDCEVRTPAGRWRGDDGGRWENCARRRGAVKDSLCLVVRDETTGNAANARTGARAHWQGTGAGSGEPISALAGFIAHGCDD